MDREDAAFLFFEGDVVDQLAVDLLQLLLVGELRLVGHVLLAAAAAAVEPLAALGAGHRLQGELEAGAGEGIDFQFKSIARTPNSVQSHRLIRYATDKGKQDGLVERLFTAYFLEGKDIGDDAVLADIAEASGLNRKETEAFLAGDERREEILSEDLYARQQGINGVPCFIFNGRYALSGAQDPSVLKKVIDSLLASEDGTLPGVEAG